ncbi:MAG: tRNA 2-thiocytidine biosynthesis TtcA family protein [Fibrobacter sp.]|jgi:tRNA(Ile)-lysidine synthase TilS/MesJ|nr:tRNA 2-thiocytidine biosynthesis TtcA family protein [Fibrobacter sp.]
MASLIRKRINKKITKALFDFSLIEPHDKILVAVSGGKDSTTLLLELAARYGRWQVPFEMEAIYIQSDFASGTPKDFLQTIADKFPFPFHFLDIAVAKRVKEGFKLNCYWCSTQRRVELLEFATSRGFNKIALGHHLDDIIETLLMNMLYKGEFSGMPPRVPYEKYPVSIIRPLCYCEEEEIVKYIRETEFAQFTCTCEFARESRRKTIRREIEHLTQGSSTLKQNLFKSMRNIKMDYL